MSFSAGRNVFTFLIILFLYSFISSDGSVNKTSKLLRKKSLAALLFTSNASIFNPESETKKGLCRWLRGLKHQNKLCQKRKGLPELLLETRKLAVNSCKVQFQYEQWNCSRGMKKFFKKVYRETAFMYSLATSAFMYLVAKACAEGKLANCKCASHGKSDNSSKWQWGGCGDNTKYAKTFTKKFLQLRKKGDYPNNILKYDSEIGIKVVLANEEKFCKCHGLSGSCSLKICWNRLKKFDNIASDLKNHYHRAIQVEADNKIGKLRKQKEKKELLYLENSPNFCSFTVGRRCKDTDNCATLCCGRGFTSSVQKVSERCNCRWRNDTLFQLQCQKCEKEETLYNCQ